MVRIIIIFLTLILTGPGPLRAGIVIVAQDGSGDVTSVQDGIDMAASGDTVLIEEGTYSDPLFIEKSLTLTSRHLLDGDEAHIHNTILDGNDSFRIMYIEGAQNVHINGLSIQNGLNTYPDSMKNFLNRIKDNSGVETKMQRDWGLKGSAICAKNSTGNISECIIKKNIGSTGSGVYLYDYSDFHLEGCIIKNNHAYLGGGGIFAGYEAIFTLDSINRCSVYLNTGGASASDILFKENMAGSTIYLDTSTVYNPSKYYISCTDNYGNHIPDYEVNINTGKIEQVTTDLYVNPETGDNSNSGTTLAEPLKTIWYALLKMESEQNPPLTLHLAEGEYAISANNERFPIYAKAGINIEGSYNGATTLNLEQITKAINFVNTYGNHVLKNVTIINGGEHLYMVNQIIKIYRINKISLERIILKNYEGDMVYGISATDMDTLLLKNSIIKNGIGYFGLSLNGHADEGDTYVRLESVKVNNITPNTEPDEGGTGGGIAISGAESETSNLTVDIINCEITENVSNTYFWTQAAGLYVAGHPDIQLINSTIADNISYKDAAITVRGESHLHIYNSIIYDNNPDEILLYYEADEGIPSIYVNYSNVRSGEDGIVVNGTANVYWNEGNIDMDPVFTTYNGTDYFLAQNSSCIHAGTMDIDDFTFPEYDLMGNPRLHGIVDMGAYENPFVPVSIYNYNTGDISISPNPGQNTIYLDTDIQSFTFTLFNNTGQLVLTQKNQRSINTSALRSGLYFYRIINKGEILDSGKWVKQ